MSKREQGFTLIELMIVVAIIAIIASIAIPNLLSARLNANESAAIATLKNISSAQAQCQASGVIDENGNGAGEYGFFAELSGAIGTRDGAGGTTGDTIQPPVLSGAFGNVIGGYATGAGGGGQGAVVRSGYVFQMFLPDVTNLPVGEAATGGGGSGVVNPANAEVMWMCYAWPTAVGNSGKRAFFINQSGDVLACRNSTTQYSGLATPMDPTAAFLGTTTGEMNNQIAANTLGNDGERWIVVQ